MFYPEELVEEVRMKNDIVDVISGYVRLQKKGSNHWGLCPFHNEKSPSFAVSGNKQMYHCFGCGVSGNVYTFIMSYENYTFPEAVKMLAGRAGVNLPEVEYSEEAKKKAGKSTRRRCAGKRIRGPDFWRLTRKLPNSFIISFVLLEVKLDFSI